MCKECGTRKAGRLDAWPSSLPVPAEPPHAHVLCERLSSGGGKSALHSQSKGEAWRRLEGHERADGLSSAPVGENELGRKVRHAGGIANGSARGDAAVSSRPVRSLRQMLQQRREHEGKCDQWSREFAGQRNELKAHPSDPGPHQVRVRSDGRGGLPEVGLVAGWTSDVEEREKSGRHHARVMHSASLDSDSDGSSEPEEDELSSTGGSLARTGKLAIAPRFAELQKEIGFSIANTVSGTKVDTVSSASSDGRSGKLDGCSPFASHGSPSSSNSCMLPSLSTQGQAALLREREADAKNYPENDSNGGGHNVFEGQKSAEKSTHPHPDFPRFPKGQVSRSKNFARLASAQPSHIAQKILLQLLDSLR